MKPGPRNLITDVEGLLVGNACDEKIKTGVTVLTSLDSMVAGVDVMGGAPGSRETDCLAPENLVSNVNAIVLSGGSAFGLDAASAVTDALAEQQRGFTVGPATVPIVPSAIIFDLINGGDKAWDSNPYRDLGRAAFEAASDSFSLGTAGAGTGATTANLKGGLGSASVVLSSGHTVGALVVVNPHGSVVVPGSQHFWAAPFEVNNEYGGLGSAPNIEPLHEPQNEKLAAYEAKANTCVAVVATDAVLDKPQATRVAVAAQDGLARAIVPAHTLFDGDLIFAVATGKKKIADDLDPTILQMNIGHAASLCVARAVARGVYSAESRENDTLLAWRNAFSASDS